MCGDCAALCQLDAAHDAAGANGERAAAALLRGYGAARPGQAELIWYAAAALLVERALRAVNCVRPDRLAELPRLLTTASSWLEHR